MAQFSTGANTSGATVLCTEQTAMDATSTLIGTIGIFGACVQH